MSGKKKIYEALLEGAEKGLSGDELYAHVTGKVAKATSKKIVRASLLALTDPDLRDGTILQVIYALAIRHRLDPVTADDGHDDDDDEEPVAKKAKRGQKDSKDHKGEKDKKGRKEDGGSTETE